jgi:hypothetical protein
MSTSEVAATMTIAARVGWGRFGREAGSDDEQARDRERADDSGHLRPATRGLGDRWSGMRSH